MLIIDDNAKFVFDTKFLSAYWTEIEVIEESRGFETEIVGYVSYIYARNPYDDSIAMICGYYARYDDKLVGTFHDPKRELIEKVKNVLYNIMRDIEVGKVLKHVCSDDEALEYHRHRLYDLEKHKSIK